MYLLKNKNMHVGILLAIWEMGFCFGIPFTKQTFSTTFYPKRIIMLLLPDERNSSADTLNVNWDSKLFFTEEINSMNYIVKHVLQNVMIS